MTYTTNCIYTHHSSIFTILSSNPGVSFRQLWTSWYQINWTLDCRSVLSTRCWFYTKEIDELETNLKKKQYFELSQKVRTLRADIVCFSCFANRGLISKVQRTDLNFKSMLINLTATGIFSNFKYTAALFGSIWLKDDGPCSVTKRYHPPPRWNKIQF